MIRKATLEDIEKLLPMVKSFSELVNLPYDEDYTVNLLVMLINAPDGDILVEKDLKGMLGFKLFPWMLDPNYMLSNDLAFWVNPENRGEGVAHELIKAYKVEAKKKGAKYIMMAHMNNEYKDKARSLYETHGFKMSEIHYRLEDN